MKRFLIFLLLGPFLGFTVFIIRDIAGGMIFGGPMGFLFGLPFAYLFGFPVVLIMWGADWWLSDKISMPVKVVTSACVGYVAIIAYC
jgi:riboflavin transporter FmnP